MTKAWIRRGGAALVASCLLSMAGHAFAQDPNAGARCSGSSNTGADARSQTFCFEAEAVRGSLVGPYGQGVTVVRPMNGVSLIRHRAHFVPEMLKSVENF